MVPEDSVTPITMYVTMHMTHWRQVFVGRCRDTDQVVSVRIFRRTPYLIRLKKDERLIKIMIILHDGLNDASDVIFDSSISTKYIGKFLSHISFPQPVGG